MAARACRIRFRRVTAPPAIATTLSILQAEFSLTQVLDQPVTGRIFFEEVIRENLDIGRPSQVSLVFDRKVSRRTPGRFRTRVITDGVVPSLHVDYKKIPHQAIPQGGTGASNRNHHQRHPRLCHRPAHRKSPGTAQDRLCGQPTSARRPTHRSRLLHRRSRRSRTCKDRSPWMTNARRRCASPIRACRLYCTSCCCSFSSRAHLPTSDVREHLAPLLGKKPSQLTPGRITYDLRRLRLHGLIERIPKTHRYRITAQGTAHRHLLYRSL